MARIDDGFATFMTFTGGNTDLTLYFWEKEVTPPSLQGGGENDTSTMHNTTYRTKSPKSLITLGEASLVGAYDPECYDEFIAMLNVNQEITITFPDDETLVFWGWIDSFSPNALVEGEQPTADATIICSNQNAAGAETAPVFSD